MINKKLVASPSNAAQAILRIQKERNIPFGQGRWLYTTEEFEASKLERIAAIQYTLMARSVFVPLATRHNQELAL